MAIKVDAYKNARFANWLFFIFSTKNIDIDKNIIETNINDETKCQLERLGIKIQTNSISPKGWNGDYRQEYSLINVENVKNN